MFRPKPEVYKKHVVNGLYVNNRVFNQMASSYGGLSSLSTNAQNDDELDEVHHGCFLEEFKESKEIKDIISSLSSIYSDQIAVERALERFQCEPVILIMIVIVPYWRFYYKR